MSLSNFQHSNIIWKERNNLVHEIRRRTLGHSLFVKRGRPYYVHFIGAYNRNGLSGNEYYEILERSIENLRKYFIQNDIDPFICFNTDKLVVI